MLLLPEGIGGIIDVRAPDTIGDGTALDSGGADGQGRVADSLGRCDPSPPDALSTTSAGIAGRLREPEVPAGQGLRCLIALPAELDNEDIVFLVRGQGGGDGGSGARRGADCLCL